MNTVTHAIAPGYEAAAQPRTLIEALEVVWTREPDRPAFICGDQKVTYGEFGRAVLHLGSAYRRLGIGAGDRVVCALSNRPEQFIQMGAAWACGAIHVGVDYQSTPAELARIVELTEASALVLERTGETGPVRLRLFRGGVASGDEVGLPDVLRSTPQPDGLAALSPSSPQDAAFIFVSSGTTGKPKASLGYQGNLCERWQRLARWMRFRPDDVHLAQLPLSHGFGLMMAMAALMQGGRLVLMNDFSAERALSAITTCGITVLNGAPTHFKLILDRLDRKRHDIHSLRFSVGTAAAFPPSLLRAIWSELGVDFMLMYGSSEAVGVATTDREDMLLGVVGKPAPGAVTIVGPDRQELPAGVVGEIAFSRKAFPVRYYTGTSGHAAGEGNISEGWYYSGDLGRLDEQGRLYVVGRLKHQIDRGGLKVDPVEVECALLQCAEVSDAAVIGVPNPILGEAVRACVVPAAGYAPSLTKLRELLARDLAPYKLPEELCILDRIPRTQIGKVDLTRLRSQTAGTIEQIRSA
jgi:acyl-CoA synthetase (AMP-forming)/AMP-acid ligase II